MPVSNNEPYFSVNSHGGNTYPFAFKIFDASELVLKVDGTVKTLGLDYTVTITAEPGEGGNIVFRPGYIPPAGSLTVEGERAVTTDRTTDYTDAGGFRQGVVDKDFDRLVMMAQDGKRKSGVLQGLIDSTLDMIAQLAAAGSSLLENFSLTFKPLDIITKGPWLDARAYATLTEADAVAVAAGRELVISTAWNFGMALTLNAPVRCLPGAQFIGEALNITNEDFKGVKGCFAGTVSVVLPSDGELTWFGDTVADFDRAVYAVPVGKTLHMSESVAYPSVATVNKNMNVIMAPGVELTRTGAGIALDFTGSLQKATIDVSVVRATDWTSGNVGIRFKDSISSKITFSVSGFQTGLYLFARTKVDPAEPDTYYGTIYDNQFYPREVFTNKIGVNIRAGLVGESYGAGNVNGNNFWGGRWSEAGTFDDTVDRYGIYISNAGVNKFYGPLIEIIKGGAGKARTMYCNADSTYNQIIGGYIEGQDYVLTANGVSMFNSVSSHVAGAGAISVYDQIDESACSYPGTNTVDWTVNRNVSLSKLGTQEVFPITSIKDRALVTALSGSDPSYVVPGFTWLASNGTYTLHQLASIELNREYLQIGSGAALGRWVDTTKTKRFWLTVEKNNTNYHTVIVRCFDAAGATLSGGNHIKGICADIDNVRTFEAAAGFGGVYLLYYGQDVVFFNVDPAVKSIWVGVCAYDQPVQLQGISLMTEGNQSPPVSRPGYNLITADTYGDFDGHDLVLDTSPIGGVISNTQRVWHMDGITGEPAGWFGTNCHTTAATVGEPVGETVVAVGSTAGVFTGHILGVIITKSADSSTRWHWTTVNGAPADGNITMTLAVPAGYTIAAGAKLITYTMKAMANI